MLFHLSIWWWQWESRWSFPHTLPELLPLMLVKTGSKELQTYWLQWEARWVKVHIFWESHKILRNLHLTFVLWSAVKSKVEVHNILWPSLNIWTLSSCCISQLAFLSSTLYLHKKAVAWFRNLFVNWEMECFTNILSNVLVFHQKIFSE